MIPTNKDVYEIPFRPNFELRSAGVWLAAALGTVVLSRLVDAPSGVMFATVALIAAFGIVRLVQAVPRVQELLRLRQATLSFITMAELEQKMRSGEFWLGQGFRWDKDAANRAYSLMRRGPESVIGSPRKNDIGGAFWLQGLKPRSNVYVPEKFLEGHTLIVGTTGSGKTRLYDIVLTQIVLKRQGPLIVIDPKGDHEMRENLRRACARQGKPERFAMFHPAYPDRSVRFDPLKNWNRGTEIATRISDLMASDGSDPFRDIAWNALNSGIQGMIEIGEKPSLMRIRAYIEGGTGPLIAQVLPVHFARWSRDWNQRFRIYCSEGEARGAGKGVSAEDEQILKMISFYHDAVVQTHRSSVVDGLIMAYKHDREHFQKLVASLIPILSMLTSDILGDLISPKYDDPNDTRPVLDMGKVIRDDMVLYVGLDSLSDSTVGSAIGAIMLADMAAVAGDIYNYGAYGEKDESKKIWIGVDEASEVLNEPAVRILNKGRGAGIRAILATQTLADVEVRMGKRPNALQALGNINNKIILRLQDGDTQEYVAKGMPLVRIEDIETGYREGTGELGESDMSRSSYSETLKKEDIELFPPPLFGEIPNLNYLSMLADGRVIKGAIPILVG